MRPLESTITPESRLVAAERRAVYLVHDLHQCQQKLAEANAKFDAKPKRADLEKLQAMRLELAATKELLATAEEKLSKRRRPRKAPVDDTTAIASLAILHLLEMGERMVAAGVDTLPGPQVLDLGDLSAPLVEAQAKFVAIRTPEPEPVPDQPKPKRRPRTRKAPVSE